MKKSVDIIGLPVIDISEGNEIGSVTRIVINPVEGSVAALVIDDGKWYLGAKLLPFSAIAGLGESAITIISSSRVLTIENAPALEQLLCADVSVIGAKVLTKAGQIQGTVKEIIIDSTGKIIACEIEELRGAINNIPAQRIVTFGKKVLIIADQDEANRPSAATINTLSSADILQTPSIPEIKPTNTAVAKGNTNDDFAKSFDGKQRKDLLGKQARLRIATESGVIIVEQGAEITEEVLQKARLANKFIELSQSVQ